MSHNCPEASLTWANNSGESEPDVFVGLGPFARQSPAREHNLEPAALPERRVLQQAEQGEGTGHVRLARVAI